MGKYVEKGKFNSKKWIANNTVPIEEPVNAGANDGRLKMSSGTYKRMDGLHNVSKMKSAMKSLVDIQKELFEEGFERDEIVEFLEKKIYHNVTVRMM